MSVEGRGVRWGSLPQCSQGLRRARAYVAKGLYAVWSPLKMDRSAGAFPGVFPLTRMRAVVGNRSHTAGIPRRTATVMAKDEDLAEGGDKRKDTRCLSDLLFFLSFFPTKEGQA